MQRFSSQPYLLKQDTRETNLEQNNLINFKLKYGMYLTHKPFNCKIYIIVLQLRS